MDVLIVEDHQLVRESFGKAIRGRLPHAEVRECGDASEFFHAVTFRVPDLVVLDVELGEHGGLELATWLRCDHPDTGIVFVTMHDGDHILRRAMALEADGFVSKSEPLDQLLTAVEEVAEGRTYLPPDALRRAIILARDPGRSTTELTEREHEILCLLADGARPIEVAASLFLSIKTVKNHLTSVYAKLGVETAAQAVAHAFRQDLVTR